MDKYTLGKKLLELKSKLEDAVAQNDVVMARNYYRQFRAVYYEAYGFDFEPVVPQDSLKVLKDFLEINDENAWFFGKIRV